MAVGAQYFVVQDSAADAIEAWLLNGCRRNGSAEAEALADLGLVTGSPPGATVANKRLMESVLSALRARGLECEVTRQAGPTAGSRVGALAALLTFRSGPTSPVHLNGAVRHAAAARAPLVTVLRIGNDLAVTPALQPDGYGCAHCLWLRHAATLPWQAAATLAPGHRVLAQSLDRWSAELVPALVPHIADAIEVSIRTSAPEVIRLNTDTMSAMRHPFLPRPDCPACGVRRGTGPAAVGRNLAEDSWCGLITSLTERTAVAGLHNLIAVGALPLRADGTPAARAADLSRGLGYDPETARARARGEALERYAARSPWFEEVRAEPPTGAESLTLTNLWPGPVPRSPARTGQAAAVADTSDPDCWVRAAWLAGGDVWVPRPAMIIGRDVPGSLAQVTSNGVAAGPSVAFSRLRAVAELLERDAVLTTWVHRRPAWKLPIDDEPTASLVAALEDDGVRVSAWQLRCATSVPVVMAVARGGDSRHLALTVGSACDATVELAAIRAISELAGNVVATAEEIRDGTLTAIAADAVERVDDHAAYYVNSATGSALDFLAKPVDWTPAAGPAGRNAGEPVDILAECIAVGLRIATCDITPPDVAACGIRVVRAVSPDLVPLWFGWHREPVDHPRLRCRSPNRAPHPFG